MSTIDTDQHLTRKPSAAKLMIKQTRDFYLKRCCLKNRAQNCDYKLQRQREGGQIDTGD